MLADKHKNMSGILNIIKRILLTIYVILPLFLLLFAREPEITSTLSNHIQFTLVCLLFISIMKWKFGWNGSLICLIACLSILLYSMDATLWQPPSTLSLNGQVAVITGANSGIGKATALAMARLGAHVVVTCRTLAKCSEVVALANEAGATSGGFATAAIFNLSSLESAYTLSTRLVKEYPRIHYLFANAGSTPKFNLTHEGLEDGFGGMHLAHVALTLGILPSLRNAGTLSHPSRIIMTSSEASITAALGIMGHTAFDESFMINDGEGDLRGEVTRGDGTGLNSHAAYGRAKLCNNLFCFEFNRKLHKRQWPVVAHALHTGSVATTSAANALGDLFDGIPGLPWIVREVYVPLLWRRPNAGARTLLYAALSQKECMIAGGQYVSALCQPLLDEANHPITSRIVEEKVKALRAADEEWAERLWNVSLRLLEESPARDVVQNVP